MNLKPITWVGSLRNDMMWLAQTTNPQYRLL